MIKYRQLRRWIVLCLCLMIGTAAADGVTLKTVSTFGGSDAAANTYAELLKDWEEQTGNTLIDASGSSDETWKISVLKDFAAGNEADVLFFFAKTADSEAILNKVTPIAEINAAYPDLHLTEDKEMAEADGRVYAIPVRPFWEGLFCNTDLFRQYGLELPTTWEKFIAAIKGFRAAGVVPIAASFSDVPHYIVEFALLASGSADDQSARPKSGQTVPDSWISAMALIRELYQMGAFSPEVNATTEAAASQLFRDKKAAMQVDGSWFANSLPQENMDTTEVLPFPPRAEDAQPACIYGVSMGFYLSRSAWNDSERRDAAVALLHYLTTGDNAAALGVYNISGRLLISYRTMLESDALKCSPVQDDMNQRARGQWFAMIPSIADGTITPEAAWARVMAMEPFGK